MKDLLVDVKKFDKKYLNHTTVELINSIVKRQQDIKRRYKSLDKEVQLKLNRIARDVPNGIFYGFSDFLNCDRAQITELCLSQNQDIIIFQKRISQKIF